MSKRAQFMVMVAGTNITVTYNSIALPAKSFSLDINNNLEDDDFRLGSLYLGDVTEKRREVTAGINVRPADATLWKQATYGAGATTAPTGLTSKNPLVITMTTYESIPGGTPTTSYQLQLTFPSAILAPLGVVPSGDDVIEHDYEVRMVRPITASRARYCTASTIDSAGPAPVTPPLRAPRWR